MEAQALSPVPAAETSSRRWSRVLGPLALVLVLGGGLMVFLLKPYSELPLYHQAGERMLHGETIYRTTERAFTYPPLFALPFVPFALLPAWAHRPLWYLINCAALGIVLYRLHRRLRPAFTPAAGIRPAPVWLFWSLVALLAGRHVLSPLENQSHDLLILLCVLLAIDALSGAREKTAGMWAGLGAALKATPLLFAPFFLWQRRWLAFAALLASVLAFSLLPDLLFPLKDGGSWSVAWYRTFLTTIQPGESAASSAWRPWCQLNQSLPGTTYRLFTHLDPADAEVGESDICRIELDRRVLKGLTLASQLVVLGGLWWFTRRDRLRDLAESERAFLILGQGAALITAMALLSPTSIKTHFCVLLLPVAFCLADFLYRRRDWLTGLALVLAFGLGTLTVKGVLGRELGNRIMAHGSVTWCAVALFLATGRILIQRAQEARRRAALAGCEAETARAAAA